MTAQIIKRKFVELDAPGAPAAAATRGARAHSKKQARLIEDAGVVRGIEVVCSCGETTIVELVVAPATSVAGHAASLDQAAPHATAASLGGKTT